MGIMGGYYGGFMGIMGGYYGGFMGIMGGYYGYHHSNVDHCDCRTLCSLALAGHSNIPTLITI